MEHWLEHIDTDNSEFQDALKLVEYTNRSVFLTGKAGTGKSTFLKYICAKTNKKHVVVAPTGIAAINAGGQTMHSFFKIPFRPILPDDPDLSTQNGRIYDFLKYRKNHQKLIKEMELLIIDEVSMLRVDILDFIDRVLRVFSGNMQVPFGGKQLLMVGDVFQLEPVVKREEWGILKRFYQTPFFFSARVFRNLPMIQIELKKVYRQSNPEFVNLLDRVRVNAVKQEDIKTINHRFNPTYNAPLDELFITLATRRDTVDYINDHKLKELQEEEIAFEGYISGEFPESALPTPQHLILKENAQVMFIKNDSPERRWYNGSLGRIDEINEEGIYVRLENEEVHLVEKEVWRNVRYKYDEKNNRIVEEEIGSYQQYPLKLAWAITVHKSQGLTFDKVMIDFSGGAFAGGQLYVALSRCRSLQGIIMKSQITPRDVIVKRECVDFSRRSNNKLQIKESLDSAKADDYYKKALTAFRKNEFQKSMELLGQAMSKRNDLTKPIILRYISRQLNIIHQLKKKIRLLENRDRKRNKQLEEFAREYFLMANECLVKAKDKRAAIANLNKAILLNPDFFDAIFKRAGLKVEVDDLDGAEADYSLARKLKPRLFKVYYNRGRTRMLLRNFNGAYNDFKKAIQLKDDHADAYFYLSKVCDKLGEKDEAERFRNISDNLGYQD
ncbi:ATP-dependent DNA helicase [Saccharicrinis fermentans]|uniref:Conjugal transfer relaxase TraA n=1 Tax=Saccharicrinis fermentans DSM 9555 = JCM 21142 TaxID=869213 RepID=W7Y035_9BACT|nr:ATP-dependent DNA helicase [Saccharicrinis fermentans]GAF04275.1 conjugal transfer relaxase TraA [Saccharicrinis fermentans DSM 9555 = JCM 21142]